MSDLDFEVLSRPQASFEEPKLAPEKDMTDEFHSGSLRSVESEESSSDILRYVCTSLHVRGQFSTPSL
jgi:hypothetical protein